MFSPLDIWLSLRKTKGSIERGKKNSCEMIEDYFLFIGFGLLILEMSLGSGTSNWQIRRYLGEEGEHVFTLLSSRIVVFLVSFFS